MSEAPAPAVLELLAWAAERPRTYAETIEAWRSSCPRLAAWEDALAAGLVRVSATPDGPRVELTAKGSAAAGRV